MRIIKTSVINSTVLPLTSSSTFTGVSEVANIYPAIGVTVKTDQDGVLYIEFSPDGVNWDTSLSFNYATTRINPPHILEAVGRFCRVRFTNTSDTDQTYLRISTHYGPFNKLTSPINGTIAESYDATVVRPTDYRYEVAMSKRQGRSTVNKFGYNEDVDSGGPEVVARFGGTFNIMTTADTLDVVSSSANDTSAGTGAKTILITGIDENSLTQTEVVAMNGTTPVTTTNSWLGVNRVVVLSSGSNQTNSGNITIDDTLGTVGTQAYIESGESVTNQAIYHTQINHNLLIDWLWVNVRKLSGGGSSPRVTIKGVSYSRVTDTNYEVFRYDMDTDIENSVELKPSQPFILGGREVFYFTAESNQNNTVVNLRFSGIEERIS